MVFNHLTLSSINLCLIHGMSFDIDVGMIWIMLEWGKFLMEKIWSPSSLVHPCHFESLWNVYFVILWSFKYQMTSEWRRWCWNDNFLILVWWLMTWMRVEWGNFWSKANVLVFFLHHFVLILPIFLHLTLIQWLKWVRNGFQSFNTQFHKSLPYPWDVIWYWCWNDLNYVGMREIFDGEDLITLIPCSSLSFWVIVKCLFCHYMVIQILNDLRMKDMMPEW